jgi:hypothetical protein
VVALLHTKRVRAEDEELLEQLLLAAAVVPLVANLGEL